jgi:hypothetical protein
VPTAVGAKVMVAVMLCPGAIWLPGEGIPVTV